MPQTPDTPETGAKDMPSPESLSYSHGDVRLSRQAVDWEIIEPETWDSLPTDEREAILREQNRRLYFALRELSVKLSKIVEPEDGEPFSDTINKILNPDQYPQTYEEPEVSPSDTP